MFYTGSIFAAWLTFAMVYFPNSSAWSWKIPNLVQGLGPVLLLSAIIVPESPRWLIKQGQGERAHQILAEYHANGEMEDPLVLRQIADIKASLELELINKSSKWSDFVRTPANRRRLAIIMIIALSTQLSGNGVVQVSFNFLSPNPVVSPTHNPVLSRPCPSSSRYRPTRPNGRYQRRTSHLVLYRLSCRCLAC